MILERHNYNSWYRTLDYSVFVPWLEIFIPSESNNIIVEWHLLFSDFLLTTQDALGKR